MLTVAFAQQIKEINIQLLYSMLAFFIVLVLLILVDTGRDQFFPKQII